MGVDLEKPGPESDSIGEADIEGSNGPEKTVTEIVETQQASIEIQRQERVVEMQDTEEVSARTKRSAKAHGSWLKANKFALIVLSIFLIITTSTGIALGVYTRDTGLFAKGVSVAGISLGDLNKEQAASKLEELIKQKLAQSVKFSVDGQQLELKLEQLGFNLNEAEALEQAYKVGREGSITQKASDKRKATQGIAFELKPEWDGKKLLDTLNTTFGKFNHAAQDATFTINSQNTMDIKDSKVGRAIDMEALATKVKAEDVNALKEIKVDFKDEQPKLSRSTLESQKITGLVASYSTKFDASQVNRTENLRVATKALNGVVLKPGDTFSFNDTVGPRSDDAGYKDAYVIVDGEFVPGLGGGICQVSSTLYNAVLLSDLGIVERNNHSLAIAYVPLGRDATVAYPSLDFKFKNDSGSYMLIKSNISGNTLTFDLYGQPKPEREVIITTTTEQTLAAGEQRVVDKSLASGQEVVKQAGHAGAVVSTTKIVKVKGEVVKKDNLGKSKYQPQPKIVSVGP